VEARENVNNAVNGGDRNPLVSNQFCQSFAKLCASKHTKCWPLGRFSGLPFGEEVGQESVNFRLSRQLGAIDVGAHSLFGNAYYEVYSIVFLFYAVRAFQPAKYRLEISNIDETRPT
jgi:hypothetical protein